MNARKAYKGMAMEGAIARWYAKNTGGDRRRFITAAEALLERVPAGGRILEVAPGPGYLAIEVARAKRHYVTGVDISETFVGIAAENARRAGVTVDFRHGNASQLPFADASFDYVVCMAAFKNFSDPVGALNEIHRVLVPGGHASIYDLRNDASREEIDEEVRAMRLSPVNAFLTLWTFRLWLVKRAYSREALEQMVRASRFDGCEIVPDGVGFELRLAKQGQSAPRTLNDWELGKRESLGVGR